MDKPNQNLEVRYKQKMIKYCIVILFYAIFLYFVYIANFVPFSKFSTVTHSIICCVVRQRKKDADTVSIEKDS